MCKYQVIESFLGNEISASPGELKQLQDALGCCSLWQCSVSYASISFPFFKIMGDLSLYD